MSTSTLSSISIKKTGESLWTVHGSVFSSYESACIWYNLLLFSLTDSIDHWVDVPPSAWALCSFCGPPPIPPIETVTPYKDTTSSKYYGVSVEMRGNKPLYRASLYINGKTKRLGSSRDEKKVAQLVNDAILEYNLDKSKLNEI